jgi:hypothetical protein
MVDPRNFHPGRSIFLASSPEHSMSEIPPGLPKHPIGTFAFVGAYAVLFVCAWFAVYYLIFMARQPVTP